MLINRMFMFTIEQKRVGFVMSCRYGNINLATGLIGEINDLNEGVAVHFNTMPSEFMYPLHEAAGNGHVDIVNLLLQNGADVNNKTETQITPLYLACDRNHLNVVRVLLDDKAIKVNEPTVKEGTALYAASYNGNCEMVELLLKNGADINQLSSGISPLYAASHAGKIDCVKLLLSRGANTEKSRKSNLTPLQAALQNNHIDVAATLIEAGGYLSQGDLDLIYQTKGFLPLREMFETEAEAEYLNESNPPPKKYKTDKASEIDVNREELVRRQDNALKLVLDDPTFADSFFTGPPSSKPETKGCEKSKLQDEKINILT